MIHYSAKLLIILGTVAAISFLLISWFAIFIPIDKGSQKEVVFIVEPGTSGRAIASNLNKQALIRSPFLFRLYTFVTLQSHRLQAGDYILNPSMAAFEIASKLVRGNVVKQELTIIEGWNLRDIARHLAEKTDIAEADFFDITGTPALDYREIPAAIILPDFSRQYAFLKEKPDYISLEGYLFPDTYQIQNGESAEQIIQKMLDNFDKKFDEGLQAETTAQRKTIFEIITLASLLEKEVQTLKDKKSVANILWKRLKAGLPLQVDATITYFTQKNGRGVSVTETKIDSPYNTYKYRGLPLGPISNPGLESMQAALYPDETPYWYYLSAPDGETIFSRNFEEHKAAKIQYLK